MNNFWNGFFKKANQYPSLDSEELTPCSPDSALLYHEKSAGIKSKALLGIAGIGGGAYGVKKLTEDSDDIYHRQRRKAQQAAKMRKFGSFASKLKQSARIFSSMRKRTVKKSVDESISHFLKSKKVRNVGIGASVGLFSLPAAGSYVGARAGVNRNVKTRPGVYGPQGLGYGYIQ